MKEKKFAKELASQLAMEFLQQAKPARVSKPRAPKVVPARKSMPKITDTVLMHARRSRKPADMPSPFQLPQHPPGVVPEGAGMAMDSDMVAQITWASQAASGFFHEGITFLGFPYLAQLAQRPEYRVISETIANEMTRKWIKIQASGEEDKTAKIAAIEGEFKRLGVQQCFRKVAELDGMFGGAHLHLDLGKTDELATSIGDGIEVASKGKIEKGSLKALKTVEPMWCYPSQYNSTNPLAPDWYRPTAWYVQGKEIHATRLLTFVGREVPDILKPAYSFRGLSMSQMAKPYVDNWLRTRQSVSDMVSSYSVSGVKTDLGESLMQGGDELFKRAALFNLMRDNNGVMLLDKETEEFFNITTPLGTLDQLQAQSQEHMASVSRIPLVKRLGIQPAGLNASSEGEIETFDDTIHSGQEKLFRPNLTIVLNMVQRSLFGDVDSSIGFIFEPLSSLDGKEKAEVEKLKAETDQVRIDSGVIDPMEARKRIASDPDAEYASLDINDTPDLLQEEEDGLEPKSAAERLAGGLEKREAA